MAGDQQRGRETRLRVLRAASAEFAEHGVAGARINRIAASAQASKERIYAWFGDKDALFDTVMEQGLDDLAAAVPITTDLVDYTVRLYDHFVAHPSSQRVAVWAWLHDPREGGAVSDARIESYRAKIAVIQDAQAQGLADPSWSPPVLLALLLSTATSWLVAPAEVLVVAGDAPQALDAAGIRAQLATATRRLVAP